MKVVVFQKGAREHFVAARALHRRGKLAQLVVDWYAPRSPALRWIGGMVSRWIGDRGRAALAARTTEIPDNLVRPNHLRGLLVKWTQSLSPFGSSPQERALKADIEFTRMVARLKLPPHDAFFGYAYMSLEVLASKRVTNTLAILDQIDPGPVHFRLVAEEMALHPELAGPPEAFPHAYFDRLRQEWDLADVIVANSEWTREALIAEGVDPAKIEILPLAFEAEEREVGSGPLAVGSNACASRFTTATQSPPTAHRPPPTLPLPPPTLQKNLRVLWLGTVAPGKGIYYLMEAARLLENEPVHFDVVGPVQLLPAAVGSAPKNMTFHGPVSRDRVADWYRQSDVFVLPTLSDGFALTQLEALAHGLPVIATPNCGRVVEDGKTGFIVPARNVRALADTILRFVRDRHLAAQMVTHCRQSVKRYSVDAYGDRLAEIIHTHMAAKKWRNCAIVNTTEARNNDESL